MDGELRAKLIKERTGSCDKLHLASIEVDFPNLLPGGGGAKKLMGNHIKIRCIWRESHV